jgi:hypothetical protein
VHWLGILGGVRYYSVLRQRYSGDRNDRRHIRGWIDRRSCPWQRNHRRGRGRDNRCYWYCNPLPARRYRSARLRWGIGGRCSLCRYHWSRFVRLHRPRDLSTFGRYWLLWCILGVVRCCSVLRQRWCKRGRCIGRSHLYRMNRSGRRRDRPIDGIRVHWLGILEDVRCCSVLRQRYSDAHRHNAHIRGWIDRKSSLWRCNPRQGRGYGNRWSAYNPSPARRYRCAHHRRGIGGYYRRSFRLSRSFRSHRPQDPSMLGNCWRLYGILGGVRLCCIAYFRRRDSHEKCIDTSH